MASEIGVLATQTLDTAATIDEIVGEVNSAVTNMTECLTTIMEFLENTVLGDYENFTKITATVDNINTMVEQSADGINGIAEKSGKTQELVTDGYDKLQECKKSVAVIREFVAQFQL